MTRKPHKGAQTLPRNKDKFAILLRIPQRTAEKLDRLCLTTKQTRSLYITGMIENELELGR